MEQNIKVLEEILEYNKNHIHMELISFIEGILLQYELRIKDEESIKELKEFKAKMSLPF
tara:strand:- start:171 stop:347 length:177 start_codon:yes stop_codon:yes gene_type:complete